LIFIFKDLVGSSLQDGLSYLVRDPAENGRMVAVRLASILRRKSSGTRQQNGIINGEIPPPMMNGNKEGEGDGLSFGKERTENGKVRKICAILHAVEMKVNF
jgi:hypothetical protein